MELPRTTYVAGGTGAEAGQLRGMIAKIRGAFFADRVHTARPGMATGELPQPATQRIRSGLRIVDAKVPSSTASDLLPNNRRPAPVWDGEPGAHNPNTIGD